MAMAHVLDHASKVQTKGETLYQHLEYIMMSLENHWTMRTITYNQ